MPDLIDAQRHPYVATGLNLFTLCGAVVAFLVGAQSLYVTFFKTPQEQRIAVSLDVSRSYLRDVKTEDIKLYVAAMVDEPLDADQRNRLALLADPLEYYSLLANRELLDPAFLSRALNCALIGTAKAAQKYRFGIPTGGEPSEIIKFAKKIKCGNPAYE
jgi:hypothetical protein